MKNLIKKITPKFFLSFYHFLKACAAAVIYGFPSNNLIIAGVIGTKGKSSAANFIWAGLTGAGIKTGLLSTANLRIGDEESLNYYHMTMPSPFIIQKMLRRMVKRGCQAAVIETTSEGALQSRHRGINYDILVFTNLTPEHIQSHGTFENYRRAKQTIFKSLNGQTRKIVSGKTIPKTIIANADSPEANNFIKFPADEKITYGIENQADVRALSVQEGEGGVSFVIDGKVANLKIAGKFNASNALPAFAIGRVLGLPVEKIIVGLESLKSIPGRMEIIMKQPFKVIVDYAHEKESLTALLNAAKSLKKSQGRIILLLGAEGGGRDKSKRPVMGKIGAQKADYLIISNVDPYEENPGQIIKDIAESAAVEGKTEGIDLFSIENRREGIKRAISLAQAGDIVLITGKGSEQSMIIGGKQIPWDDRVVVKELLKEINYGL